MMLRKCTFLIGQTTAAVFTEHFSHLISISLPLPTWRQEEKTGFVLFCALDEACRHKWKINMSVWLAPCSSHINYKAPLKKEFGSGGLAPPDMIFFFIAVWSLRKSSWLKIMCGSTKLCPVHPKHRRIYGKCPWAQNNCRRKMGSVCTPPGKHAVWKHTTVIKKRKQKQTQAEWRIFCFSCWPQPVNWQCNESRFVWLQLHR